MILAAGLLLSLADPPLSQRPIWDLNDSELCEAARQTTRLPRFNDWDVPLIDFGAWEVECEPRVLRIPLTVLDSRLDPIIVEAFTRPDFCEEPNLVMFWNRGWHFEIRFRFSDGTTELTRPCETPGPSTTRL